MNKTENVTYTPGPWSWYGNKALEALKETVLCGDCGNATCGRTRLFVDEANARLIAAAPEMLEALENIVCPECDHILKHHADRYGCQSEYGMKYGFPDIYNAIAVIRKAKGEL